MLGGKPFGERNDLNSLFARYHVGWKTRDPDLIASFHSDDTIFWMHDGSEPVTGRDALRRHCSEMFANYRFGFEEKRTLYGGDHWVLEWTMVMDMVNAEGDPFVAKVEMLDVVSVNDKGEVTRKDVYVNGAQMLTAYDRAGLKAGGHTQG